METTQISNEGGIHYSINSSEKTSLNNLNQLVSSTDSDSSKTTEILSTNPSLESRPNEKSPINTQQLDPEPENPEKKLETPSSFNEKPDSLAKNPKILTTGYRKKFLSTSSKLEENRDFFCVSSPIQTLESEVKINPFSDISIIGSSGNSHFLNLNDRSDYSIDVAQLQEIEEAKLQTKIENRNLSDSEEETLKEIHALETALKPTRKFSSSSEKDELDQALLINNSEIQLRELSDDSGMDTEILKKIQTEPSELCEAHYRDIDIYESINDPPVRSLLEEKPKEVKESSQEMAESGACLGF